MFEICSEDVPITAMSKHMFANADDWRMAAMQRPTQCDATESALRQQLADTHNQQENISDADVLIDQQLYIQGKMDKHEYQDYLFFKHRATDKTLGG